MNAFDTVTLRIFNTPIETFIKFYNSSSPWHKKLPDIMDEVLFYDAFNRFIHSALIERMRADRNRVTIIGLPKELLSAHD